MKSDNKIKSKTKIIKMVQESLNMNIMVSDDRFILKDNYPMVQIKDKFLTNFITQVIKGASFY